MGNYIDLTAVAQVIGCVFNDNSILDAPDEFPIFEEDFTEEVHKIILGLCIIYMKQSRQLP